MKTGFTKTQSAMLLALLMPLAVEAGTWGTIGFNSGKWGAKPDVYTISSIEPGPGDDDLVVAFVLDGAGAAPETIATSFSVTCGAETVAGAGSPIIVTGLTDIEEYLYTVVAINGTGSSSSSAGLTSEAHHALCEPISVTERISRMSLDFYPSTKHLHFKCRGEDVAIEAETKDLLHRN